MCTCTILVLVVGEVFSSCIQITPHSVGRHSDSSQIKQQEERDFCILQFFQIFGGAVIVLSFGFKWCSTDITTRWLLVGICLQL